MWEVYSAQIAGTLPQLYDLLFLCDKRAQLQSVPGEAGRPGSQSMVFNFTGQPGMYSILCVRCLLVEKYIYLIFSLYGVYEMKKYSKKYIIALCTCTCTCTCSCMSAMRCSFDVITLCNQFHPPKSV